MKLCEVVREAGTGVLVGLVGEGRPEAQRGAVRRELVTLALVAIIERLDPRLPKLAAAQELGGRDAPGLEPLGYEINRLAWHGGSRHVHLAGGETSLPGQAKHHWDFAERQSVEDHGGAGLLALEEHAEMTVTGRVGQQLVVDPGRGRGKHFFHLVHITLAPVQELSGPEVLVAP
ncbi:MAG: hypothetical protein HYU42_10140 [Candidatus Rokubacteria bacterium]|nr:hypothetical protein [Candidatus Rokubacteria bacterium]